jgi:hypothetical protein
MIGEFMRLRFEKTLAVLPLVMSMAFVSSSLRAENEVPAPSEDAGVSQSEVPAVLLPDISFHVLEDGRVHIQTVGFNKSQVSRFTFDGQDVTEVIEGLKESGVLEGRDVLIEYEESKISPMNGFEIVLAIEPFVLQDHSFGVVLINGIEIQKIIDFEASKGKYATACLSYGMAGAGLGAVFGMGIGAGIGGAIGCAGGLLAEWSPW